VETRVLVGQPGEEIVRFASKDRSRLVVVGTRAARGIDRLLQGSVADLVMRNARQPVLIVPPVAAAPERRARTRNQAAVKA
jgi:nucleotide-binding universal stress UspA family protein